jgi:hypothetical protein
MGGLLVAGLLAGCSSDDAILDTTNGEAVAIGQQALTFGSSSGSSSGWTSPVACPASFEEGLRSGAPSTDSFEKLDPSTVSGPTRDPDLTTGYVATCVYRVTSSTGSIIELAFFDIDETHTAAIESRLTADGFVSQGTTNQTLQGNPYAQTIYANATTRIVVESITIDSVPAFIVVG